MDENSVKIKFYSLDGKTVDVFNVKKNDIIDFDKDIKAGTMSSPLKTDYSTLALRILANNGYLFRGSRMSDNMALTIPFGGE